MKSGKLKLDSCKSGLMIFFAFLVVGCASSTSTPNPTSTPTPTPACGMDACVKDVYLELQEDNLFIHFDLTDKNFEVNVGETIEFQSPKTFALFLVEPDGKETYLMGAEPKLSLYSCYVGNDLPWTNGHLGATCGMLFPLSILQVRIKDGDTIRVEITTPKFSKNAIWLSK